MSNSVSAFPNTHTLPHTRVVNTRRIPISSKMVADSVRFGDLSRENCLPREDLSFIDEIDESVLSDGGTYIIDAWDVSYTAKVPSHEQEHKSFVSYDKYITNERIKIFDVGWSFKEHRSVQMLTPEKYWGWVNGFLLNRNGMIQATYPVE